MTKLSAVLAVVLFAAAPAPTPAFAGEKEATVWKSPSCGCCTGWIKHLEGNGYKVKTVDIEDVDPIKDQFGVPKALRSCHTAKIDGYVVEGHVPADAIDKLLKQRPKVGGLASPGMPGGSPGMEGAPKDENVVIAFPPQGSSDSPKVFGRY